MRRPVRHIAFLCAINVGKRIVKMDHLRKVAKIAAKYCLDAPARP